MKNGMIWMALVVAVLVSTNAWAVWGPDGDAALKFNMNFEDGSNVTHTTSSTVLIAGDSPPYPLGTLVDFNTDNPNVFGETSAPGLGKDANFADMHDNAPGSAVSGTTLNYSDCHLETSSYVTIFDLGGGGEMTVQHTWTFWFNVPSLSDGTVLRHASIHYGDTSFENAMWEIRIYGGKIQFYHKNNSLKMETASSLAELGLTVNTWHHAAVVIDRSNVVETGVPTTQLSSKIYVDGLEAPIIVTSVNTSSMNVDTDPYTPAPIWIGAGERNFDGLLDEVRLFSRDLNAVEVSILNQPDKTQPVALLPIPRSSNVVMTTGVSWVPAGSSPAPTAQALYFGKDPNNFGDPCKSGDGSLNSATNAELKGPFPFNTKYYWYVKSTIGGVDSNGPLWSFTTETGKAINLSPIDGADSIDICDVNLLWTTPTAATYAVYASATKSLVDSNDVSVRIANGITDPYFIGYDPCLRGTIIYWRVNSTYPTIGTMPGNIWSFRTKAYELVFNTSSDVVVYEDYNIPGYTCLNHSNGWSDACATGSLASDGVAVFNFPNGFNYDKHYDITVVPAYRATDICSPTDPNWFPTPLAIHVTGDFYLDGRVQIAGDDVTTSTQAITFARSGGFPGPKNNQDTSVFNDRQPTITDYWTIWNMPAGYHGRFGTISSGKTIYVPTDLAKRTFGPGQPVNPPYKGGGGGGSGGIGGEAGRGYFFGVYSAGPSYGDKEVPVPFGGSAGGWGGGSSPGGAAGGGGIEIVATGNVVLDSNSQINTRGGGQLCSATGYPAGGGGGGSVRIIAGGSVTNKGIIDVNGGNGGDGTAVNNTGGGGGGGRVAIFHSTTYTNTGTIAANGGARGTYSLTMGMSKAGQNGTIFDTNGSPKKASTPTPENGYKMVYTGHPDPCTIQLEWYSGYGGTTDRVYCDTFSPPTTQRGGDVAAARGQHSVNMTVSSGNTYYWKVVTDGTVSSDTWSFKTVNWRCRQYDGADVAPTDPLHVSGPEWDYNRDCVLDIEDFDDFANDWLNPAFGAVTTDTYWFDFVDFARYANEWRQCINRTDGGCAGF
jgi:hypothetical protein